MAAIDKLGIINIIDKHFDALNGEYSPYVIEGNSTVFSFFKKLYDILKDGSIFENNLLLKTYEETIKEILVKLEQIENRKIYQYNFANSSDINDIKNSFTEMLKYLWKYVDRHFPQTLTENEQKVGYYNKNFGHHIEKEIEVEHTEESYEQISNEELQAGPQQGEEYYVHPIASTEIEYNPVTELEPQAGVEYYTNPVVSTREDYSLTQDSEPQPGAEYYVRSIIETIEIYNLAEESEPKADETYYTHPINEREVYTEESEPQQGEEYYVHPVSSIEENYSNVTEEEPRAGVEYYVHPTVEREVYNLVQDKSSVLLPYNEYYKHDENTYIPCAENDFNITTSLKSIIDFYETKDELYISKRHPNSPLRDLYSIDKNTLNESELLCSYDDLPGNSTLYKNDKIFYTERGIFAIEKDIQTNKNMLRVIYDTSSPDTPMGQINGNNDDVFIINRIDGADGYEVYLYDYSTNAVRKATGIDESLEYSNDIRINTKNNETFVITRKKVYLFNKKLVKDENNNYSYTYKYKGIYKNGVYEDWTTTDFVLFMDYSDSVNFMFNYSNLLENKNGVVSGCLAVNCYNKETSFSSIAFYTMDNEYSLKLVAFKDYTRFVTVGVGSADEGVYERSEDHMRLIGYKDENNRCIFISEILNYGGIKFDVDVYDNPQFSDTENTEKIKHKLIRFNYDNTETNAILNNEYYTASDMKFVGTYMIEGIKYLRFALLGTNGDSSILTFFNLNISDQLTASSTFKYGFYSYDDESIFTMEHVPSGEIKENHVIFDREYNDSGNHVVETRCFDFDYKFANSNKQIIMVENTNKTSYVVCVKEQEDDEYIYRIYKFDNGSFIPTDKVLTIRDSRNEEFVDILWDKKIYSNNDLSKILIFNRRDRTIIDGNDSISFKEDIEYYTKSQIEELNTSSYVKNDSFGYTTISNSLNEIGNHNMLQAHDIYNDVDTLYIRKGTGSTVEMYKLTDNMSEPTKLFSVDLGSVNVSNLLYTNGKLFVFDNGVIIDYLQNEQRTWSPITSDQNWNSGNNSAVMCGNNLVLIKQITEDVPDKDKFEIYYYDYTTRDLQKASEIPATLFRPNIKVTKNNILIFVTDDNNRTTCYIFNKQFTKVENTLNQYTSSSKYSGTVDSTGTINDYSSNVFIPLPFTEDTYISKVLCDYLDSNGILFIGTFNGVAIFKTNENNQIVNSLYVENIDYIGGDYINTTSTIFRDEDSNNYYFIYNEASGRSFKILVYKNPGITDNETEKQKISVIWDDGYSNGEYGTLFGGDIDVSQYIVGKYTTIDENDRMHEFLKIYVYLSPVIDNVVKRKFTFVNLDITDINDPNYMTNSREMLKYSFDGINDSSFSEVYDDIYRQENYILCYKENPQTIDCYDFYYKIINSGKHVVAISEPYTTLDPYDQYETPIFNQDQTKLLLVKEDDDSYRIYTFDGNEILPTDNYIESTDDISVNNQDTNNWWFFRLITLNGDNENYLTLINGVDLITNKSSFEEGVDYFTKTVTKTYDNSSYVLAENLEEGIPYFTKTIVKEVVDDTSYVPAGDLQSFDDDIDYFTKTIAYTYDDSSYEPAGNLQSFDENTQYFNKIVTNTYDTSSYVPAENLQVFDDGASYFTKSITYIYDDSSYEPTTDLQSFDENIDYFTKKITVVTETQTISTYESDDGTELKFNGYKEDIIIGGKLLPIYNENGKVEYDNDVYIKMLGVDKVYPEIIVRLSKNEEYKYYNLNDAILTIFKNDNYKKFSTNDVDSKNVLIEYSFDNGFVVNDNNEYESPNGLIYELFLSALRSIVDSSRNYFMEKLKKYFYDGIVSRYREKKIEDKRTSLVIRDDGLNSNGMMVVPKVYEKLGGKGGSIGSITTLDFDKKINFDSSEYIRMVFDDAYYNTKTNNIELYFDLSYMNGFIKSLSTYRGIDGFINNYAMRFDKDANIRQWLLINKKEIEEAILKNLLFAIEPCFWPDYTNDESWNKNFYVNNAAKLQKVYYYNNKTYSKEDELLKDLNLSETNKKFVEYSVIRKQRNISIDFDNDKFIILLKNEDRLTIDKELFDENDSYFERNTISNEEYNEKVADYFEKLNLEKLYLGSGYINVRKVPQKFKDNGVSELVDCEYVNKNVFNESEEFSSILDDREFIILHNVNTKVSNGNNVFYDTENNYSDIEFPYELEGSVQTIPIWKSAKLYKKKHYFELVCSNFMKKNNIEAIKQIRVMQPTNNKNRYLFNVRSIENRTTEEKGILFDINFKDLEDYKISYVLNNTLHIPNQSVLSTGINEDTLRLSSLPDNEKFDYYSDSSLRITYGDEKFPSEEQYVFGDTMYIKSPSNIVEEEELLILAERSKEYKVFTSEYIMILEPGLETNKLNIADGEYINVQILDFLQVSPGAINVELPQLVYDNEGNGSVYVKTVEPEPLIFRGFYKKFELIDSSPSLLVERRNMVNFNINKQNLIIKKELNKKITFKENLKFSKQMTLRIFDESPKLELFENKWLKCKRLNGSLECKVSNMGELQLEKIERVYLEFPEFSDRNTILQVNFLPEEARLINSVIKLLPNNYTFRNDKNAVYIYDSNGNSVDTLYKNFYLDCDVPKQGEKNIEGKKFIDFEFRPSREYFNGTDRWMQLINNQPFVIPLIEGMDQELKKFEVMFH